MKNNFSFNFIIQIILFISILNEEKNNIEFKGIYRIDSLLNQYSLIDENYSLQFYTAKEKHAQMYRIIKNERNLYYIESKRGHIKLGVNQNGHVLMVYNPYDKSFKDKMEWNIFKIEENQYIVQNNGNNKFMEVNNNFFQCMNDLPTPFSEHKSEISNNFRFNFFKLFEEVNIKPEHEVLINNEPIDVVIKYIDLTDKTLNRTGIKQIQKDEDNEELRYSVRSIFQYIPWVRKIFIIMPNEKVKYFKPYEEIKEKIVYVKDKDLLGFDSANIYAFTLNLFRLEKFGVSDNFIYMDDDFFIGKKLSKSNFFYYDEKELKVLPSLLNNEFLELDKEKTLQQYKYLYNARSQFGTQSFMAWALSLLSTEKFFIDYYKDKTFINPTPTHNAISYNIKDLKEIYDLIINNYQYANETLFSLERHILTLQTQHFVDLYTLNIKNRKVHTINYNVIPMKLLKPFYLNVDLFVINTGGDEIYTEEDFKNQREIMEMRVPEPSPYEIPDKNRKVLTKHFNQNQDNGGNDRINAISSNDNPQPQFNPVPKDKNYINELNMHDSTFFELENKALIEINQKQSIIIKISNSLIILMSILIIILFYLYFSEKNKNVHNNNRYKLSELTGSRRLEILD